MKAIQRPARAIAPLCAVLIGLGLTVFKTAATDWSLGVTVGALIGISLASITLRKRTS